MENDGLFSHRFQFKEYFLSVFLEAQILLEKCVEIANNYKNEY